MHTYKRMMSMWLEIGLFPQKHHMRSARMNGMWCLPVKIKDSNLFIYEFQDFYPEGPRKKRPRMMTSFLFDRILIPPNIGRFRMWGLHNSMSGSVFWIGKV